MAERRGTDQAKHTYCQARTGEYGSVVGHSPGVDRVVQTARTIAGRQGEEVTGATLLGDERSGRFSHDMAKGEYRMVGRTVIVTVTEKHWLLPWPLVEAQLRELVL